MKKILYSVLVLAFAFAATGCSKDDGGADDGLVRATLDFEGAEWDALVDDPQNNGPLLYGDGYAWYDEATGLYSELNEAWGAQKFYNGGCAVSNYFSTDYEANSSWDEQLTVCATKAHSGKNCIVCYGYNDLQYYSDSRPSILFAEGTGYFESLYVCPTTLYTAKVRKANAVGEKEYIRIVATGITSDAAGTDTEGASAELYLYKDGKECITTWTKWELKSLGEVNKVRFDVQVGNDEGVYKTHMFPAYFAIDDITVAKEKK